MAQTLAIGPIFSAGLLAGTVAVFAGFNTPLSVLLGGLGTLALFYVLALYGRRFCPREPSTSTSPRAFTPRSALSARARICSGSSFSEPAAGS